MEVTLDDISNYIVDTFHPTQIDSRIENLLSDKEQWEGGSEELDTLQNFKNEIIEQYGEDGWANEIDAFIADYHFKDYARELAYDLGDIQNNSPWPFYCIDWDWAARELKMDYTFETLGGIDYWFRSY